MNYLKYLEYRINNGYTIKAVGLKDVSYSGILVNSLSTEDKRFFKSNPYMKEHIKSLKNLDRNLRKELKYL